MSNNLLQVLYYSLGVLHTSKTPYDFIKLCPWSLLCVFSGGLPLCRKKPEGINDIVQSSQTLPQILKIGKLFPDDYRGIL